MARQYTGCDCQKWWVHVLSTQWTRTYYYLPPPLPRRRLQHRMSATADEEADHRPQHQPTYGLPTTHGAFELTADAPGFMRGGLRIMDSKYHGIKLIEKRVDGIRQLREIVSLYPTRRTCHWNLSLAMRHGWREPRRHSDIPGWGWRGPELEDVYELRWAPTSYPRSVSMITFQLSWQWSILPFFQLIFSFAFSELFRSPSLAVAFIHVWFLCPSFLGKTLLPLFAMRWSGLSLDPESCASFSRSTATICANFPIPIFCAFLCIDPSDTLCL